MPRHESSSARRLDEKVIVDVDSLEEMVVVVVLSLPSHTVKVMHIVLELVLLWFYRLVRKC